MEHFVSWEALRLSWTAPEETDSHLYQDLEQEGMLYVYRLLQRDQEIWMKKLEQFTCLHMRIVLRRGRSVFRADPGPRQRQYRQVPLTIVVLGEVCTKLLPLDHEHALLHKVLDRAQQTDRYTAEHQALLVLKRLARSVQDGAL
jgi:hypothetical protein